MSSSWLISLFCCLIVCFCCWLIYYFSFHFVSFAVVLFIALSFYRFPLFFLFLASLLIAHSVNAACCVVVNDLLVKSSPSFLSLSFLFLFDALSIGFYLSSTFSLSCFHCAVSTACCVVVNVPILRPSLLSFLLLHSFSTHSLSVDFIFFLHFLSSFFL